MRIYLSDVAQSQLPMHATSPHRKKRWLYFHCGSHGNYILPKGQKQPTGPIVPTELWIKWLIKKQHFPLKILTVISEFWIWSYTINKLNVHVEWLSTLWGQIYNTRRSFIEQHHHKDSSVKKKKRKITTCN